MKIIFDLGFNNGQNFDYFLMKSDVVIGFDANKNVYNKVSEKYKFHIKNRSLILENLSLVEDEKQKSLDFYISKKNDVLSTLYPENKNDFYKVNAMDDL